MDNELTPKQKLVLQGIREYISRNATSPTFTELIKVLNKKGLTLKSNNSLTQYLEVLEEKGFIEKSSVKRGIRLIEKIENIFVEIPLLGNANCGEALSYADGIIEDFIQISRKWLHKKPKDYFFVKAIGDSMDKAGIKDQDMVLIRKIDLPENGDIVVAVINGLATIKVFQRASNGTILLMPKSTNLSHQPIVLHPDDSVVICGKVDKVFDFK